MEKKRDDYVYRAFFIGDDKQQHIVIGTRESIYALKELLECRTQALVLPKWMKETEKLWK